LIGRIEAGRLLSVENLSLSLCYLADTSYLKPNRFFEFSGTLGYPLLDGERFKLRGGFGLGYSEELGQPSISGVLTLDMKYFLFKWMSLNLETMSLLYSNGYILDPRFYIALEMFKNSLIPFFGIQMSYASLYDRTKSVFVYQINYGVGITL